MRYLKRTNSAIVNHVVKGLTRQRLNRQLCLLALLFISPLLTAQQTSEQQLEQVKHAIAEQKQVIDQLARTIKELEQQLQQDDKTIAHHASELRQTQQNLTKTEVAIKQLREKHAQLSKQKQQQETTLSEQLQSAYLAGRHDYLKMLLNQQDTASVQRSLTYYQYLNKARIGEIERFQALITELLAVEDKLQQELTSLDALKQQQLSNKQSLEAGQLARQQTIKQLNANLNTDKKRLAKLEQEEQALSEALAKLAAENARKNQQNLRSQLTGLAQMAKLLNEPVKGKVRHHFGQHRQGHLRWKGLFYSTTIGEPIHTIHYGTIIFSDWVKGYGLVAVVDHGQGYMSLYGHNQALLKKVGDIVEAGEPLALAGQSGGNSEPGLYFEIRHQGIAVDPKPFFK